MKTLDKAKKLLLLIFTGIIATVTISVNAYALEEITGTGTVTASDSLNVRSGPGKEYDSMGKLYSGNAVDITGVDGEWLRISYNNADGYVAAQYVDYELEEPEIEEEVIEETEDAVAGDEMDEVNDESTLNYKVIFGLIGAIVVVMIVILLTIKNIKNMDDDYDYEDDYEEDDDEEYDDEEDDYEDDDEYDEEEDDDDEYEYVTIRRPKNPQRQQVQSKQASKDDFLIDIDPRYFD